MSSRRDFLALLISSLIVPGSAEDEAFPLQVIVVKSRSEAVQILAQIRQGAPFAFLANRYSNHPSAKDGGFIESSNLPGVTPQIREALKAVGRGNLTGVVETPQGYAIARLLTRAEGRRWETILAPKEPAKQSPPGYELVTLVSGGDVADAFFKTFIKPSGYELNLPVNCDCWRKTVDGAIVMARGLFPDAASANTQETQNRTMRVHYLLGQLLSYQEDMAAAVAHFQAAYDLSASLGLGDYQTRMEKVLAIAYFRLAEDENWVRTHNPQSSIFPLGPESKFERTEPAEKAAKLFLGYLEKSPEDLEEKWLLNLTVMTMGKYPGGIPERHRISLEPFESKDNIGRFVDIAPSLGLDVLSSAGGVIIDDFDNDGFLDVVLSDWDACTSLRYFHNNGDGTFSDRTSQAGLASQLGGLNIVQTDYNNDGWLDIYVPRGAWRSPVRHSLLRNNGDGTFTDVTVEAGLEKPATSSQVAMWADFDNDGLLDLFVGNENAPSQLFHNNGDGTFTDVAHISGVDRIAITKSAAWGDFDNDGRPDLYVSNLGSENFLYHNNGDGTFTEIARDLHVEKPLWSYPTWFFDYDNDGWLDLYVAAHVGSVTEVIRSYLGLPTRAETQRLYRNLRGSAFQDVTREVGLDRVVMPMGNNFGDVDNDGFLDFYLGTGAPSYAALVPNMLFRNQEGRHFVDITASSGTGSLQKGHGVAIADIFNDGQPAIFSQLGGMGGGDRYYSALFRNPGTNNNWIDIKLVGVKSNRAGIGARIKVALKEGASAGRYVYRDVNSGGSFGASPLRQHVGMGKAQRLETLEIWWPTSKTWQIFHNVSANQFIQIQEFADRYVKLDCKPIQRNF